MIEGTFYHQLDRLRVNTSDSTFHCTSSRVVLIDKSACIDRR
jgi:hypothetical protein